MPDATSLPMHVPTQQHFPIEQRVMSKALKERLHLPMRRQLVPRSEYVDAD